MAYIAFASAKGSPGVTTAVTALAAAWPADRALLVADVDPSGGDLVVRLDLATDPGLVSLAAAGRRELDSDRLVEHTQVLAPPGGGEGAVRRVLVAPVSAEQATVSLGALRGGLGHALDEIDLDVLVDCGRLDPSSAAFDLAVNAELLVMVARPVVAEVHHLSSRLASAKPRAVSLLMVGDKPYSVAEVAATVGASPLGTLPVDVRAAAVLAEGHPNAGRLLRRAALLRDARSLAEGLCEWLGPQAGSMTPGQSAVQAPDMVPPPAASPSNAPPSPTPAPSPVAAPPSYLPPAPPMPTPEPSAPRPPTSPASWRDAHDVGPSAPPPVAPSPPPFTPTLPADNAGRAVASPPPRPSVAPPVADSWPGTVAAPDRGNAPATVPAAPAAPAALDDSGDSWTVPVSDEGRSGRLNGRRRLGGAPKHFRRDPEDQGR